MGKVIDTTFDVLAALFDKVPLLSKFKGYRSAFGLAGLLVVAILQATSIGSPDLLNQIQLGFLAFTGLALNAKGR